MSGGSYNYLCYSYSASQLACSGQLENMEVALRERGFAVEADLTKDILALFEKAEKLADQLRDVWKAEEWLTSCDWGIEELQEASAKLRKTLGTS